MLSNRLLVGKVASTSRKLNISGNGFSQSCFSGHVQGKTTFSSWPSTKSCFMTDATVQKHWTKQISRLAEPDYVQCLKTLSLYLIQQCLLWTNLILYWKILTQGSSTPPELMFQFAPSHGTRCHSPELAVPCCKRDLHKRSFWLGASVNGMGCLKLSWCHTL